MSCDQDVDSASDDAVDDVDSAQPYEPDPGMVERRLFGDLAGV